MTISEIKTYINENNDKTISEIFQEFEKEHNDVREKVMCIEAFDDVIKEKYGDTLPEDFDEDLQGQLIDFYQLYFDVYFTELDPTIIYKWKEGYPYCLQCGYRVKQCKEQRKYKDALKYLRPDVRENALEMIKEIISKKEEREIYFLYKDDNGKQVFRCVTADCSESDDPKDYEMLLYFTYMMLTSNGVATVYENFDKFQYDQYRANNNCTWEKVTEEEKKRAAKWAKKTFRQMKRKGSAMPEVLR